MNNQQTSEILITVIINILVMVIAGVLSWITSMSFGGLLLVAGLGLVIVGALQSGNGGTGIGRMPQDFTPEYPELDIIEYKHYQADFEKRHISNQIPPVDLFKIGWIPLIIGVFLVLL